MIKYHDNLLLVRQFMALCAFFPTKCQKPFTRTFQAFRVGVAPSTLLLSRSLSRNLTSFVQKKPHLQPANITAAPILYLPESCPGCGAYTHVIDPDTPGYYDTHRKSVKLYLQRFGIISQEPLKESVIFEEAAGIANGSLRSQLGLPEHQNDRGTAKLSKASGLWLTMICCLNSTRNARTNVQ